MTSRVWNLGFGVLLGLLPQCSSELPAPRQPLLASDIRETLECELSLHTDMSGTPVAAKIPRLWIRFRDSIVLRAVEFADGRVVRNPYSLKETAISSDLQAQLKTAIPRENWPSANLFRLNDESRLLLFDPDTLTGAVVTVQGKIPELTLKTDGREKAALLCRRLTEDTIAAHEELIPATVLPLPPGCADQTIEQSFGGKMVGCSGTVLYTDRLSLCGKGWTPCKAEQWVARFAGQAPRFMYWTDDDLRYSGSGSNCQVSTTVGNSCDHPMRVCADETDPLGNHCNWKNCGLDKSANEFFGGCSSETAGTLCCLPPP